MTRRRALVTVLLLTLLLTLPALADPGSEFLEATGLRPAPESSAEQPVLQTTRRGYRVTFQVAAGDVWGRYFARLALGEASRGLPGVVRILFEEPGQGIVGSEVDRLLSRAIGQPLSLIILLEHGRPDAPRLDIVGDRSLFQPPDPLPEVEGLGGFVGDLRSNDPQYAARVLADEKLRENLDRLRYPYLRVDSRVCGFFWAGDEMDYSAMIREHGGYAEMVNGVMDDLADLADRIPAPAD